MRRRSFLAGLIGALLGSTAPLAAGGGSAFLLKARAASNSFQTSITYGSVTFNFDRPVRVGFFVNGWPYAISDQAFNITSITPASADLNSDGSFGNGAMQDPYIQASIVTGITNARQGFDGWIGLGTDPNGTSASITPYLSSLNVDPGNTGIPIAIAQGQETSIVKTERLSTAAAAEWQTIQEYVTLTILATIPAADAFPPGATGLTKTIYRASQINLGVFRSLTMPATFPTLTTAASKVPTNTGIFGNFDGAGELLRRYRLDVALGTTDGNYSAQISNFYSQICVVMHDNRYSNADKQALLYKIITFGIQIDSCYLRSLDVDFLFSGAGQGGAWLPFYVVTAFVLQDTAMITRAKAAVSQLDQTYWTTQDRIDNTVPIGDSGNIPQGWFQEMLGMPLISATGDSSEFDSRYGVIGGFNVLWDSIGFLMLQNGPSGETGYSFRLAGGADNNTNARAASLGYMDRTRQVIPYPMNGYDPTTEWYDLYDLFEGLGLRSSWTGVPDQPHLGTLTGYTGASGNFFTPAAGQIAWDYTTKGTYTTQAITDVGVRYSLDGIQWVEQSGVGESGTLTSLLRGAVHYCGLRRKNASGWGPWSQNYPYSASLPAARNAVTTTGSTTAAAPVNIVAPVVCQRLLLKWSQDLGNWTPSPATLADGVVEVQCGLGYWSGFPSPTYTYQWTLGGVDIAGATSKTYSINYNTDIGQVLACRLTATNASGSASITTAGVTVPSPFAYICPGNTVLLAAGGSASATVQIGQANADRWIFVLVMGAKNTGVITSVDIGGQAFTKVLSAEGASQFNGFSQVWRSNAKIPAGTSGTLNVASSGTFFASYAEVMRVIDTGTPAVFDSDTVNVNSEAAASHAMSVDVTADGFVAVVGASYGAVGGNDVTISNVTNFSGLSPSGGDFIRWAGEHTFSLATQDIDVAHTRTGDLRAIAFSLDA